MILWDDKRKTFVKPGNTVVYDGKFWILVGWNTARRIFIARINEMSIGEVVPIDDPRQIGCKWGR
jgi:hypothetical protein